MTSATSELVAPSACHSSLVDFPLSFWWTGEGSNLRRPQGSADLQSAAFDHSATCPHPSKHPGKRGHSLTHRPRNRFHLSQVGRECGWARTLLPARAILNNPDLVNPLPNLPTRRPLARFLSTDLTQTGAGEGIRTPDPLITNQMLYRLSYASRCKLTIILIGRQIARKTGEFFRLLKS